MDASKYQYISTAGSHLLKSRAGVLDKIIVGETSAQAVTVHDSIGSGGTQIANLKASIAENSYEFECRFAKGLYIENPGGSKITITYR